ncbi:MAG: zinc-binding dehydrogenase [Candidatus Thermoplasmatota archaeon]
MTDTMQAAVFHGAGKPLSIEKVPVPQPGSGDVLVKVAACGFCHTDLHYLDHGVPTAKKPPLILGHETSGTVATLGPGSTRWKQGDRVLLPAVLPCGRCQACRTGRENICADMRMFGNHVDGGFAEYVLAPEKDLIALPPDIDLEKASIIADALSTPYHAVVNRAQVRAGEWVAIVGCGGVGMNAVQFAAASGANVLAIDLRDDKLDVARKLGAVETINPTRSPKEFAKDVRRITGGGADVAIEAVGSPATIDTAFSTLRRGGRVCLIGYSEKPAELPAAKVMFFEYTIMGSLGCRPADYPRIVEMVRRGHVKLDPLVTSRTQLSQVNEAADRLRRGEGLRSIIVPDVLR